MTETTLLPPNAAFGTDTTVLHQIHSAGKNISIFQRDIRFLEGELEQFSEQPFEFRHTGSLEEIVTSLQSHFANSLNDWKALLSDVTMLLESFQDVTASNTFRIYLATVNTNMCRRFHTDINELRLLCTYIGPGTLWLPDEAVDQKVFHSGGTNEEMLLDTTLTQQVNTGAVAILKGALYPAASPILHRSPTIEESKNQRLLLRIDTGESLYI